MNTNIIIRWALCLVGVLTLSACRWQSGVTDDDDRHIIYDFAPIYLYIDVQDPSGRDLVDPKHPHTITKQSVRIEVKGQSFKLSSKATRQELRYYMPQWYGIYYEAPREEGKPWRLVVGQFDGAENGTQEVTLHWGDGTSNQLRYSNAVHYKNRKSPEIDRHYYLDGKEVPSGTYRITKQVPN